MDSTQSAAPVMTAQLPDGMSEQQARALAQAFTDGSLKADLPAGMSEEDAKALAQALAHVPPEVAAAQPAPAPPASNPMTQATSAPDQARHSVNAIRDNMVDTVAQQKAAVRGPIDEVLAANGPQPAAPPPIDAATAKAAAEALADIDPKMVALANAMASMSSSPALYQSVLMIEAIKMLKAMIRAEVQKGIDEALNRPNTA